MSKDMEWMGIILNEHKLAASMLTSGVIESANPQVRQHFSTLLNQTLDHQKQIFDLMSQKGICTQLPRKNLPDSAELFTMQTNAVTIPNTMGGNYPRHHYLG